MNIHHKYISQTFIQVMEKNNDARVPECEKPNSSTRKVFFSPSKKGPGRGGPIKPKSTRGSGCSKWYFWRAL